MGVKRYFAKADNTIANAFEENLVTRATGSNMGASDILEVFSIYGQASSSAGIQREEARALLKFNVTASANSIKADRSSGILPVSGSVNFYLRLFNARHGQTLPKDFTMDISAVKNNWVEGHGLDMELYGDKGSSNWASRLSSSAAGETAWTTAGGDHFSSVSSSVSASFDTGAEDIDIDITDIVEQWVSSSANSNQQIPDPGLMNDNGLLVLVSRTLSGENRSYYTKKFFGRNTEFFFKKPCIEARWNSTTKDDRGNFYYSSSLATPAENLNTIYFYNYFRGQLRNIPDIGTGKIYVSFFSGNAGNTGLTGGPLVLAQDKTHVTTAQPRAVTGSYVSTGIYSASVAMTASATPLTKVFDVWFSGGVDADGTTSVADATEASIVYHTGAISPRKLAGSVVAPSNEHVSNITNLKSVYRDNETARFRVYTRQKDWVPTIYTKATAQAEVNIVESGSYEIYRIVDDLKIVPYGTGSTTLHTQMSFDVSGSYFDLDMEMLEPGYMYGIKLSYYNNSVGSWVEQPETFKFRVESRQS